ncbi:MULTISPECIES: glutamate--cysteine ligase [unclassified Streptomyces]|uniref:glutamate--cysteine ligase n=1 Tax=unclassified Streptomyces TaxID=2593676 RepID=UPI002E0E0450|nr:MULTISPECIES: glutamate--cysteine ligase [unclassified Streptomyces]WSR24155.1 glutamate--cysteine ligase [Streptomyces sp. NBC_01205]
MRSVGVEEELLLVDPRTGQPAASAGAVLASALRSGGRAAGAGGEIPLEKELHEEQVECATRPLTRMDELHQEIRRWRAEAARHAQAAGVLVAALATCPLPVEPSLSVGERYQWIARQFGLPAQEQLTCGCHVHVAVDSDEEGVAVLDRIRPWLSVLAALSANSPFWQGEDTGYGSYRSRVWNRWPSAGPVDVFGTPERYHERVRAMVATGAIRDEGMIYFDARLAASYPTVEIRVADVCLDASTAVLLAALVRALVDTAARDWRAGEPSPAVDTSLLRLAAWRAARSGLDGPLIHPATLREGSADIVVRGLYEHVREALEDNGDADFVEAGLAELQARGNGARIQRELLRTGGDLASVVLQCARRTLADEAGAGIGPARFR